MNIHLTAIIKSKPAYINEVKAVLQNLVVQSRKEAACIQYDLHQSTQDNSTFIFHEIWESQEGLNNHNNQPYLKSLIDLANEKLQEQPTIYLTQKI